MIKHIVAWKIKQGAEGLSADEIADRIKHMLEDLNGRIAGVRLLEVGKDFSQSPNSFDLVLYSEFEDMEALQRYQDFPEHIAARDFIGKVTEKRVVVDYEVA